MELNFFLTLEGLQAEVDNVRMMCPGGKLDTDFFRVSEYTGDDTAFMIDRAVLLSLDMVLNVSLGRKIDGS